MATSGPNNPASATEQDTSNIPFDIPNNALTSNDSYATVSLQNGEKSNTLQVSNFGFALAVNARIDGITVEIESKSSGVQVEFFAVSLMKAGSVVGSSLGSGTAAGTSEAYRSFGGSANLWGTTWLYSDINNSGFGVAIILTNNGSLSSLDGQIDSVRVTIDYTLLPSKERGFSRGVARGVARGIK